MTKILYLSAPANYKIYRLANNTTAGFGLPTLIMLGLLLVVFSCSPLKKLHQNPTFANSFTGFVLFDPEKNQVLFEHQGSKYFTPASNTKLFTFYTANRVLGDSIPAFQYRSHGDSIWLWGTGDPSFLNPELPSSAVYPFLKDKQIFLVRDRFKEPAYGPGWAWDDYAGSYQRRKAAFPIYGNAVYISWDSLSDQPRVNPPQMIDSIAFDQESTGRTLLDNRFTISRDWQKNDTIDIPLYAVEHHYQRLWADTLGTTVQWVNYQDHQGSKTLYSIPAESVFKRLLQVSDNFLAEQLILLCSWQLLGQLNSDSTINLLTDSLLNDLPQAPIWVDGSGLSRYNLFTPSSMVVLLNKIYQEVQEDRLFELLPAGGKSGTIKNYYQADPPYIYAKTGTLRNNHALSGYLITKRGKRLIFSFMHNHYPGSSTPIKLEMEKILWQIHLKY